MIGTNPVIYFNIDFFGPFLRALAVCDVMLRNRNTRWSLGLICDGEDFPAEYTGCIPTQHCENLE